MVNVCSLKMVNSTTTSSSTNHRPLVIHNATQSKKLALSTSIYVGPFTYCDPFSLELVLLYEVTI